METSSEALLPISLVSRFGEKDQRKKINDDLDEMETTPQPRRESGGDNVDAEGVHLRLHRQKLDLDQHHDQAQGGEEGGEDQHHHQQANHR